MKKISFIIVSVSMSIILGITIARYHEQLIFLFSVNTGSSPKELPIQRIGFAFGIITEKELPKKANGLRAIFEPGRDPTIFVRFETDSEGIEYIKSAFAGPSSSSKYIDSDTLKQMNLSGLNIFFMVELWQEKLGISLYDQDSIESGLEITSALGPGVERKYKIFIDDKRNIVYICAFLS